MTRDNEYIRDLLFEIETQEIPYVLITKELAPSNENLKRNYHIELLCDAGLMTFSGGHRYRLTNQGHDYIEAIKNDTVWKKTKDGITEIGGATLGMVKDIAIAYLKQEAVERLGIKL